MGEYDTKEYECQHCGPFVLTISGFITTDFEVAYCPNCREPLDQ